MNNFYLDSQNIKADSFILIPCYFEKLPNKIEMGIKKRNKDCDLIDQLKLLNDSEISQEIGLQIERTYIKDLKLRIVSDVSDEIIADVEGELYFSFQMIIKTVVATIVIPNCNFEITYLYDQVSRNKILICDDECIDFNSYLLKNYGLTKCGTARTFTSLSSKPHNDYIEYLLSNEVYRSDATNNSSLCSDDIKNASERNIAQFDFSQIYAYDTSVVQIEKYFDHSFENRLYVECLTVFIIEFLQFQEAAVSRVNYKVTQELHSQSKFSVKKIQNINLEFSKSIKFWNINIFVYPATQKIVDRIAKAFELEENIKVFNDNKNVLEHLIMTHSIIVSDRENKILNYTVLFLTLTQVIPIYYTIYEFVSKNRMLNFNYSHIVLAVIIIALIGIIKRRINERFNEI